MRRKTTESPADLLDYEIAQEKAAALGRLGRALEAALDALTAFDLERSGPKLSCADRDERKQLVLAAGRALWFLVVQRETIGLRDTVQLMRDYRVPAEVQRHMGVFPDNAIKA